MLEIIQLKEKRKWNEIVKSFDDWDIYYLNEYAYSLSIHHDGEPILIYYHDDFIRLYDVVMKQDIQKFSKLSFLMPETFYDFTTPYGYGGPYMEGEKNDNSISSYFKELKEYAIKQGIVTEFIRFHPLLQNQELFRNHIDVLDLKETIYIETCSESEIWNNIDSKNRNMIRKAMKNNIQIIHDKGEFLDDFIEIYEATMDKNNASDYYYFEREYFEYLIANFKDHIEFFYAIYDGKIISASIFYYNKKNIHYHLSGTLPEFRNLASSNLLLYTVSLWAMERGIKQFHLGGGVGVDDSLFSFKKKFNKNGHIKFDIGRIIFDEKKYSELINLRAKYDSQFDKSVKYLIKYRAE